VKNRTRNLQAKFVYRKVDC